MCEYGCVDNEARTAIRDFAAFLHEKEDHKENPDLLGPACKEGLCYDAWFMDQ